MKLPLIKIFFDEDNPEKDLAGRLFLILSNQRALDEMLSLWKRYQSNPQMKFDRGLAKFRDAFLQLKNIRRWDVQDRLFETGILDNWKEDIENSDDRVVQFEIELWFRKSNELRVEGERQVKNLIHQAGGRVLQQAVIKEISYHGLLAELPVTMIQTIIENPTTELVLCENIMFFI